MLTLSRLERKCHGWQYL